VRTLLCFLALGGVARAESLWEADLRAGYGVAMSGSQGTMSARPSPLTLEATGSLAVNEDPNVAGFAGLVVETLDRTGVGTVVGARLTQGPIRLAGGGTWIFAPYTLWGAIASAGTCIRVARSAQLCGDAQLTTYFAGTDLVKGHAVTQAQLVIGVAIDAP
jgi:hypothetical protein